MNTLFLIPGRPLASGRRLLFLVLLLLGVSACKISREEPGIQPDPGSSAPLDPTALVCAPGESTGEETTAQSIGAAGGTLTSDDGRLRIEIPAGALPTAQSVSIQPITNTNPSGRGVAYRLEPHGMVFSKPVKLTLAYQEHELNSTLAEALQVAYQTSEGIWMAMPGAALNKQAKTLTIETTHFSDWSMFASVYLSPLQASVGPGESLSLAVYTTLVIQGDEAFLAPLDKAQAVIQAQQLVELGPGQTVPVSRWTISSGGGSLARSGPGSTNTYRAPGSVNKPTPVTVTAQVKSPSGSFLLLLSSLMVMPQGIVYRIDGGPWVHKADGSASRIGGQVISIGRAKSTDTADKSLALTINIPQLNATQDVNLAWGPSAVFIGKETIEATPYYQSIYVINKTGHISPGGVYLSQIQYPATGNNGVESITVRGNFSVPRAGLFSATGYLGEHVIEGYFCLGTFR
ncbi:hypothetical protein [Fibrella forsythiae]|uniref:ZU5 domain-containing protein n=1 Tax=Fibrella forsythiae TaxID=2817061 RepID=A0ABS3JTU5_9BACT|nr:hypothetical protein [Fibrella forsythiae]MBO0952873.1 hypothetical protein [Fibrella forsythiae]